MRRVAVLPLVLAPLVLTACAQGDAREDPVPPAQVTGPPETCIPINVIATTRIRSDSIIDFIAHDKRAWRVTLSSPCPTLKSENKFAYETSLSHLCNTDIITVLHDYASGIQRGASCGLSPFVPVTLPKGAR
jgi:hypothetical protein